MTERKFLMTVLLLCMLNIMASAQQESVEKISDLSGKSSFFGGKILHSGLLNFPVNKMKKTQERPFSLSVLNPVAGNYYCNGLGFFCRKEWQLEKATAVAVRFRLGSLAYTNYLEGKPNALPGR